MTNLERIEDDDPASGVARLLNQDAVKVIDRMTIATETLLTSKGASAIESARVLADGCRRLATIFRLFSALLAESTAPNPENAAPEPRQTVSVLSFPPFQLDLVNETLWRNDVEIPLQAKRFKILRYLAEHAQRLVTQRELIEAIWGKVVVSESLLRTHVRQLRQALGDGVVQTINARGYRFVPAVHRVDRMASRQPRSRGPAE